MGAGRQQQADLGGGERGVPIKPALGEARGKVRLGRGIPQAIDMHAVIQRPAGGRRGEKRLLEMGQSGTGPAMAAITRGDEGGPARHKVIGRAVMAQQGVEHRAFHRRQIGIGRIMDHMERIDNLLRLRLQDRAQIGEVFRQEVAHAGP